MKHLKPLYLHDAKVLTAPEMKVVRGGQFCAWAESFTAPAVCHLGPPPTDWDTPGHDDYHHDFWWCCNCAEAYIACTGQLPPFIYDY